MNTISAALVLAVQYIAARDGSDTEDDDVNMLEQIGALLQNATEEERSSLLRAAKDLDLPDWAAQMAS
jgi:hypothetical protein